VKGLFAFWDREFIRKFASIALPVAMMNLINFGVNAVDTLMLGRLDEIALSGVAVANQLSFMFMIFAGGVASGCGVLAAQYWGAGDKERVREIFAFMFRVMVFFNLAFAAVAFFIPHLVLGIITTDLEVINSGVIYLRIMSLGYLVWGFTNAATMALRSVGVVKISVVLYSVSLIISASFNYLLIFGNLGFPRLEIAGAAIATVMARFAGFIILAVYILKIEKNFAFRVHNLIGRTKGVGKGFMRHGFPVVMNEVFWASGFFILNVIIGRIGREFVAANAISGLLLQFSGMILFSSASAAAVIVGNAIGEGKYEQARKVTNGMVAVNFITGLFCMVIIQVVRVPFVNFYELSDTAHDYAFQLTQIISFNVIFMAVADSTLMGALRGGGDTKFVMIADVIFMWLISIPIGAVGGLLLGWPVWLVFIVLRSDSFFKTMLVLWRVPGGKWLKDVTKA